jgi:hypothetical protein
VSGKPFYSTIQYFNDHNPIDRKTVKLSFPETLPLHILNTGISETCTTNSGTISYQWEAENQPAIKQEESLPPWWTFNPTLFISAGNWEEYTAQLKQKLGQAEEHAVRTQNLAEELTKNISSPLEKVRVLRNWVAKTFDLPAPILPLFPFPPSRPPTKPSPSDMATRWIGCFCSTLCCKLPAFLRNTFFPAEFLLFRKRANPCFKFHLAPPLIPYF